VSDLERFMRAALDEAERAGGAGELPVGAVLVVGGTVVAAGRSRQVERGSALAHAELEVLERGSALLRDGADDAILVTTVEPCLMCLGAALRLGVGRIAFGAANPNAGVTMLKALPAGVAYEGGILEGRARDLMGW
jgi:tRNA(Arg) A34 adenosine deaminase TadA